MNELAQENIRLLLQGPPGSGKTTAALNFPGVVLIDIDVNSAGPRRYHRKRNNPEPVAVYRIDQKKDGSPIGGGIIGDDVASARGLAPRYDRLNEVLIEAQKNPECRTIVIDSATGLSDVLFAWTQVKQSFPKDGRQTFGFFLNYGKQLINTLTSMNKHIVLIAHERIEKDQMTQVDQYRVAWPGQLGDYIGAFFTNVWRCEIVKSGYPPVYTRQIRTVQDTQFHGLKNDFELPPTLEFTWQKVQAELDATKS